MIMRSSVILCSRRAGWLLILAVLVVGAWVQAQAGYDATARAIETHAVVDEAGKPVAIAMLRDLPGDDRDLHLRPGRHTHGTLHLDCSLAPLILVAGVTDHSRAGITHVDAEATEATFVVKPTATASGRLTETQAKPIAGQVLG
jgi:hypothetical protein